MGWGGAIEQVFGALRDWWARKYDGASRETYALKEEAKRLDREYREALARYDVRAATEHLHRLWVLRDKLLARSGFRRPE